MRVYGHTWQPLAAEVDSLGAVRRLGVRGSDRRLERRDFGSLVRRHCFEFLHRWQLGQGRVLGNLFVPAKPIGRGLVVRPERGFCGGGGLGVERPLLRECQAFTLETVDEPVLFVGFRT